MGLAPSPDIKRELTRDLYAHVDKRSSREEMEWSKPEDFRVKKNQQFFANDYVASVDKLERVYSVGGVALDSADIAVRATIRVKGEKKDYFAEPVYIIRARMVGRIPFEIRDLGVQFTLTAIHPETDEFTIQVQARQKDWIVIRALEKPFINVLWLGTFVVMIGFGTAMRRRFSDFKKMKAKGLE
jgi:cytochrome c-type biogenesis protein CcmF